MPLLRDRYVGCLLGLALGDALGAPLELMRREEIAKTWGEVRDFIGGGWLNVEPGEGTDDTQLAVAVATSLITLETVDPVDIVGRFVTWYQTRPKDIGKITRTAIRYHAQGLPPAEVGPRVLRELPGRSAGNGPIVRGIPVALLHAARHNNLVRDTRMVAEITHADPFSVWAAIAVNLAIADLVAGRRHNLIERVAARIDEPQVREALLAAPDLERSVVRSGGHALETLSAAFWALQNHDGVEEVLVAAINLGEDADTVGAIAGALAGAREGSRALPEQWGSQLRNAPGFTELAFHLYQLARKPLPASEEPGSGA